MARLSPFPPYPSTRQRASRSVGLGLSVGGQGNGRRRRRRDTVGNKSLAIGVVFIGMEDYGLKSMQIHFSDNVAFWTRAKKMNTIGDLRRQRIVLTRGNTLEKEEKGEEEEEVEEGVRE